MRGNILMIMKMLSPYSSKTTVSKVSYLTVIFVSAMSNFSKNSIHSSFIGSFKSNPMGISCFSVTIVSYRYFRLTRVTFFPNLPMSVYTDLFVGMNYTQLSRSLQALSNLTQHAVTVSADNSVSDTYYVVIICVMGFIVVGTMLGCVFPSTKPLISCTTRSLTTPVEEIPLSDRQIFSSSSDVISYLSVVSNPWFTPGYYTVCTFIEKCVKVAVDFNEYEVPVREWWDYSNYMEGEFLIQYYQYMWEQQQRDNISSNSGSYLGTVPFGPSQSWIISDDSIPIPPLKTNIVSQEATSTPVEDNKLESFKTVAGCSTLSDNTSSLNEGDKSTNSGIDILTPGSQDELPTMEISGRTKRVTFDLPPLEENTNPCHCVITMDSSTKKATMDVTSSALLVPSSTILPSTIPPLTYDEAQYGFYEIINNPLNPKNWPYLPDGDMLTHLSSQQYSQLYSVSLYVNNLLCTLPDGYLPRDYQVLLLEADYIFSNYVRDTHSDSESSDDSTRRDYVPKAPKESHPFLTLSRHYPVLTNDECPPAAYGLMPSNSKGCGPNQQK